MPQYPEIYPTYIYLAEQLNKIGIAYIHLVDNSSMGISIAQIELQKHIRVIFKNIIIIQGGYDKEKAEEDIENGLGDLVAFGQPFINNPDLVERFKNDWPLSQDLKMDLFYSAEETGYTDYPFYKA